ncbi:MAG: PatB family C-S lyase [Streptococcaceae bacterium]|jgi:cystathionine beta-lyase|nr:PatB family C-S lyase [Streptococcaceae bacterium]
MYDFSTVYNRKNTNSIKWDYPLVREKNLLPMWIADMDFPTFPGAISAMKNELEQGFLGYTEPDDSVFQSVQDWYGKRHQLELTKEEIVFSTSVVSSLSVSVEALTSPGDAVLVLTPIYPPFFEVVQLNNRKVVTSSVKSVSEGFQLDFEDIERKIRDENVKLFLLCNPHNPGGKIWNRQELNMLGKLMKTYNVLVVSDEIHADILPTVSRCQHTSFFNAGNGFKDFSIVLSAPSKTFNLAGAKISTAFIKNPVLRQKITQTQEISHKHEISSLAFTALKACFLEGENWLTELNLALYENILYVEGNLIQKTKVQWMKPEAGYLIWLDFSAYRLTHKDVVRRLLEAGVFLNDGRTFGREGRKHMRMNIAAPMDIVIEGVERIRNGFRDLE